MLVIEKNILYHNSFHSITSYLLIVQKIDQTRKFTKFFLLHQKIRFKMLRLRFVTSNIKKCFVLLIIFFPLKCIHENKIVPLTSAFCHHLCSSTSDLSIFSILANFIKININYKICFEKRNRWRRCNAAKKYWRLQIVLFIYFYSAVVNFESTFVPSTNVHWVIRIPENV